MHTKKWIMVVTILMSFRLTYGLTFNVDLSNQAEIDIYISKFEPSSLHFICPARVDEAKTIARYSMLINNLGKIMLWKQFYGTFLFNAFIFPGDHLTMPLQQNNPLTIELLPEDILNLGGANTNQVFVAVQQRTFMFNPINQGLTFFAFDTLMQGFEPLSSIITVTANGVIAPSQAGGAHSTYQIASGWAS